jgi:hypothetical protein
LVVLSLRMITRLTWQCLLASVVLSGLWSLPGLAAGESVDARAKQVFVMVASKNASFADLSLSVLRRAYDGDPTRLGGVRLVPFNYPPEHALRQRFDWLVLELRPSAVGRYWIDRRIRGEGHPPRTLPNPEVLKAVVARLPGAIGYLLAEHLDSSVRGLTIDGRSHTDPAYALSKLAP